MPPKETRETSVSDLAETMREEIREVQESQQKATKSLAKKMEDDRKTIEDMQGQLQGVEKALADLMQMMQQQVQQPPQTPPQSAGGGDLGASANPNRSSGSQRRPDVRAITEKITTDTTLSGLLKWRRLWDSVCAQQSMESFPLAQQFGCLLLCMEVSVQDILQIKCHIDIDNKDQHPNDILDKLEKYLASQEHEARDRLAFNKRTQRDGETVSQFHMVLEDMGTQAKLCTHCRDKVISYQLIGGLQSDEIRREVLSIDPLPNLETVVKKCISEELSRKNLSGFRVNGNSVNQARSGKHRGQSQSRGQYNGNRAESPESENRYKMKSKCKNCNRSHGDNPCPAKGLECRKCKKVGHFAVVCRSGDNKVGKISSVFKIEEGERRPKASIQVRAGHEYFTSLVGLPDTGADICVMSESIANDIGAQGKKLKKSDRIVRGVNGIPLHVKGEMQMEIKFKEKKTKQMVVVCYDSEGVLLSYQASVILGILEVHPSCYTKMVRRQEEEEEAHNQISMVRMITSARSWKNEPKAGKPSHQATPVKKKRRDIAAQGAERSRLVEAIENHFPPQKVPTIKRFVKLKDKLQVEMDGRVLKEGRKDNPGKVRKKVLKLKDKVQLGGGKQDECNTRKKISKLSSDKTDLARNVPIREPERARPVFRKSPRLSSKNKQSVQFYV